MFVVRLLGQFSVLLAGRPVEIPSRPAQSILAYLLLNPNKPHRRERLAGQFWPDASEANARSNLRHVLWRIRKALSTDGWDYLLADDLTITFQPLPDDWLDVTVLVGKAGEAEGVEELSRSVAVYAGELLPGFYDEWVILERGHLQAVFEGKMQRLLDKLVREQCWTEALEQAEGWIVRGYTPEPAYRALLLAHAGLGDLAGVAQVYQRCTQALREDLGVEPSEQTRSTYEKLVKGVSPLDLLPPAGIARDALPIPQPVLDEAPAAGEAPYKGLQHFEESDARLFYGRELLTARLVGRLREGGRLLVIVGASGSGKSSLVRAGVIPALRSGARLADGALPPEGCTGWPVHVLTPTAHPLEALAVSLTSKSESVAATATLMDDLAADPRCLSLYIKKQIIPNRDQSFEKGQSRARTDGGSGFLVVVDQLEELFTLCREEAERKAFVDGLLYAALADEGPARVVLVLRADFYAQCAQYANLRAALGQRQEYIGPMSAEEMRRAIEGPARTGGWEFEAGLVELVLRDVGADAGHPAEPGGLPLLSHALLETWARRRGRRLTLAGYAEAGGVHGAIARTAERVYGQLSAREQAIARGIFLRLTELGEGAEGGQFLPDTRRRAAVEELIPKNEAAPVVEGVLQTLVEARLVTAAAGSVEVAHEALIRAWPTLRKWLAEDREGLRMQRRLTEAAQEWEALGREPGELYRGARLAQAREWAEGHPGELNQLEDEFLTASVEFAGREAAERERQRQHELEMARQMAVAEREQAGVQRRLVGQLRRRAVYLTITLLIAGLLAAAAVMFGRRAEEQARLAEGQARLATSREVAAAALSNLEIDSDLSLLLALYAAETADTLEAENALHQAIAFFRTRAILSGHLEKVIDVFFNADGTRLASMDSYGTVKEWDLASGKEIFSLPAKNQWVNSVALSPDGSHLARVYFDGSVNFEEITPPIRLFSGLGQNNAAYSTRDLAFRPDGRILAKSAINGAVRLFDPSTGHELASLTGHSASIPALAWSWDGKRLASASSDGTIRVWEITAEPNSANISDQEILSLTSEGVQVLTFSPDGNTLITGHTNGEVNIWDTSRGEELVKLTGNQVAITAIAVSPDGKRLATGRRDMRVILWDLESGQVLAFLTGPKGYISGLAFSPDGNSLATASADKTVRVWDVSFKGRGELLTRSFPGQVLSATLTSGGARVATVDNEGTVKVWEAASGDELLSLPGLANFHKAVLSPDGKQLVEYTETSQTAVVWDLATRKKVAGLPSEFSPNHLSPAAEVSMMVVFSQDGKVLLDDLEGGTIVWDAASWHKLFTFPITNNWVFKSQAISSDGKRVASFTRSYGTACDFLKNTEIKFTDLEGLYRGTLSLDGRLLAAGDSIGRINVWDVDSGLKLLNFMGHTRQINSLAFNPDQKRLASASDDGNVKIWDLASGQELYTLGGNSVPVDMILFSQDGKRLASVDRDGTLRVYTLQVEDLVALAKERVSRSLTEYECEHYLHLDACPTKQAK